MTNFSKKQEEIERSTKDVLGKISSSKIPRLVQPQSGTITNNFSEGDIYISDNTALLSEIKCLKKSLQEKERIIAVKDEEIELLRKGMIKDKT